MLCNFLFYQIPIKFFPDPFIKTENIFIKMSLYTMRDDLMQIVHRDFDSTGRIDIFMNLIKQLKSLLVNYYNFYSRKKIKQPLRIHASCISIIINGPHI